MFAPDREPDADQSDSESKWPSFPWEEKESDDKYQMKMEPKEKRRRRIYRSESPPSESKSIPLSPLPSNKPGQSHGLNFISPLIKSRRQYRRTNLILAAMKKMKMKTNLREVHLPPSRKPNAAATNAGKSAEQRANSSIRWQS